MVQHMQYITIILVSKLASCVLFEVIRQHLQYKLLSVVIGSTK